MDKIRETAAAWLMILCVAAAAYAFVSSRSSVSSYEASRLCSYGQNNYCNER